MEQPDITIHLAVAFDIGYEIDLGSRPHAAPGESGPLARRRRPPESLRYRPAPLRVPIDPGGLVLPGRTTVQPPRRARLRLRSTLAMVQFLVRLTLEETLRLAGDLADPDP